MLDASITLAWFFEGKTTAETDGILDRLEGDSALVPAIWSLEVANALLTAERHQRLQVADTARFLSPCCVSCPFALWTRAWARPWDRSWTWRGATD